jgi:non-specific serine/threonine protein kinase
VLATLRPYQRAGLDWLTWLADNRVGGILADDMGLGKTLQVLAWIQADHPGPTLVVCPVTLVDTWARQAAQFTPGLRVASFHGAARGSVTEVASGADLVVTTYGLLARDEALAAVPWHRVVLDEAQAIKNPDTQAARAARGLTARHRLVVTGTPVENHLGDLWSLMAFAHPGLLPRRKAFTRRYAGGDAEHLARLRAVVSPFLLRRVKTDPGILPDLPDREVIRADCTLTREQVGAYEAVVADMLGALEELRRAAAARGSGDAAGSGGADGDGADPMGRRAAVLGGITRLKQICVHPALLTESRRSLGDRSGKVTRLTDLCAQIVDEGQAVVVFTQFASFVPDLAEHLHRELGVPVATLTGSHSRAARAATVAAFSDPAGPPILIASLKAGGTGLTLVRANHVIHLDRWWNPAVEDQASDRVWRIGQQQKVSVHVLVCPGTLEDRIDEALTAKRSVAASVVRSTEAAITELSDADLAALVGLVRDRVLA